MERDVILKFALGDGEGYTAKTSFSSEELDQVIDTMRETFDDPQDDPRLLRELESKGYVKITGIAPEVIEIF